MSRIFIITQNEPFYIPKMIKYLLAKGNFEIVGYTVLKPHRKNKNIYHWFKERARIYTIMELMYVFVAMFYVKFFGSFKIHYSVSKILNKQGVKRIHTEDVNDENYVKELGALNLDFIISISCPHLFGEKLLALPNKACLNAHGTLLPRHRGVFGSWWTIFKEDKEAGGTIHTMELKLDAGHIVWQEEFEVTKKDTQYSIAYKTKKMMSEGLVKVIEGYDTIIKNPITPRYKTSYHRAPTKELGKEFHKKGKKVLTLANLKLMLSANY